MSESPSGENAVVVQRAYDFNIWLIRKVEHFPRSFRFSVGDRIITRSLNILETLTAATWSREKRASLDRALLDINSLRMLLRTATDLGLLAADSQEFAAIKLEEIGRMTGGWRKALK